jgi:hypothetical protein
MAIPCGLEFTGAMAEYDVDIGGCAETNLAWTDELEAAAMVTLQRQFGNGYVTTSSSSFKSKTNYLPGGTAIFARGDIIARIIARGSDSIGRYSWITLKGNNDKSVCIITAYRVPQSKTFRSTSNNDSTAHHQQMLELSKRGLLDPDLMQETSINRPHGIHSTTTIERHRDYTSH